MNIQDGRNHSAEIKALLTSLKLPAGDLPDNLENFLVAMEGNELIGVAGLEIYGDYGLVRSVAVKNEYRSQGIASSLLNAIEKSAKAKGLMELILLTETAPDYFVKKGFAQINRIDIASEVQQSSEFSHVCPQSAIAMKKSII